MKTCKKCGDAKPESEYYRRHNSCKECVKARVRANRAANAEHYKEFDRQRANNPDRVAARLAYSKTVAGKASHAKAREKFANSKKGKEWRAKYQASDHAKSLHLAATYRWIEKYPEKKAAQIKLNNAKRAGKIVEQPCEVCGTTESIEAHHDDYSKPLDVRWLCTKHHAEHHRREREQQRRAG